MAHKNKRNRFGPSLTVFRPISDDAIFSTKPLKIAGFFKKDTLSFADSEHLAVLMLSQQNFEPKISQNLAIKNPNKSITNWKRN